MGLIFLTRRISFHPRAFIELTWPILEVLYGAHWTQKLNIGPVGLDRIEIISALHFYSDMPRADPIEYSRG